MRNIRKAPCTLEKQGSKDVPLNEDTQIQKMQTPKLCRTKLPRKAFKSNTTNGPKNAPKRHQKKFKPCSAVNILSLGPCQHVSLLISCTRKITPANLQALPGIKSRKMRNMMLTGIAQCLNNLCVECSNSCDVMWNLISQSESAFANKSHF